MRHFYFHLRAGDELLRDDQGQDFPDVSSARIEAEKSAREIVAAAIRSGKEQLAEGFGNLRSTGPNGLGYDFAG